eukprot:gene13418-biopygen9566
MGFQGTQSPQDSPEISTEALQFHQILPGILRLEIDVEFQPRSDAHPPPIHSPCHLKIRHFFFLRPVLPSGCASVGTQQRAAAQSAPATAAAPVAAAGSSSSSGAAQAATAAGGRRGTAGWST